MLGIVLRALRRRRTHAATLFLLGLVAATAAAAAPGYAVTGAENLAASALASASAAEHIVSVQGDAALSGPLDTRLTQLDATIAPVVDLPGFQVVNDARLSGQVGDTRVDMVYRQGVCDRLSVVGACPRSAGEVTLADDMARLLHAVVGTRFTFAATDLATPVPLQVVGIYRASNPSDPYWGESTTAEDGTVVGDRFRSGTMFTPLDTFVAHPPRQVHVTVDFIATAAAVREHNPQTLALSYEQARPTLGTKNLGITSAFRTYADRNLNETNLIYVGVVAATLQLLILVWFALALAIRQTAGSRRPDVGLMKLRGVGRRSLWSLTAGQAAVPIVAGGVVGLVLGAVGVRLWAGPVVAADAQRLVAVGTVAAAAAAVVIAIVSALVAERRMLAEPVAELARRVPARQRGWRAGILDAAVLALALAAAVELRSSAVATNQFRGLDVLAPTLVALAVGIIAAWLVPRAALLVSTPALRTGRVGTGLSAVHLARRTSLPRVLTMLTLAVAVLTGAAISWGVSTRAQDQRAQVEVGAARVLTVQASSSVALLDAVRAADPEGRYAMAAVRTLNGTPTLAVDSTRLAAVVPWSPAYGLPGWPTVARALQAGSRPGMTVHSGLVSLDATWAPVAGAGAAQVAMVLEHPDGTVAPVTLGTVHKGLSTYRATLTGCDPQCRLVGFTLNGTADLVGSTLTLGQVAGAVAVSPATFADRTRWRTSIVPGDELPTLASGAAGLALTVAGIIHNTAVISFPVYVNDAVSPLPMYAAGEITPETRVGGGTVQAPGAGPIPADLVGTAAVLPRLGATGRLVDLTAVDQLRPGSGRLEVWLAAGTPASVVQALTGHGLSIVDDESTDARVVQLRAQGPSVALRYLLVVALVGFVLAVGAFAIAAAVERPSRAEELAALRWQGLRPRTVRATAYGGYLAFAVVSVVLGVATALLAGRIIGPPRVFGDDWSVLATPSLGRLVLALLVAALFVSTAMVALTAGAALTRAVRSGGSRR